MKNPISLFFLLKLHFTFFLFLLSVSNSLAQSCIQFPAGAIVNETGSSGSTCDYSIDLCVEVPSSPSPKRIDYSINYDSNGDTNLDATSTFSFSPGGRIPAGTHCLSTMAPSEEFNETGVPCGTVFHASIIGYTNNSGGTGGDCASTSGTIDEVNGFAEEGALPVKLISFSGRAGDHKNILVWRTASEENFSHFIVERRSSGDDEFEEVGKLFSNGDANFEKSYQWVDLNIKEIFYYRLKMVDFDNSFEYSDVVFIQQYFEGITIHQVFPNPTNGNLNIDLTSEDKQVQIEIFNVHGKKTLEQSYDMDHQSARLNLNVKNLPIGWYVLRISDRIQSITQRFVKE